MKQKIWLTELNLEKMMAGIAMMGFVPMMAVAAACLRSRGALIDGWINQLTVCLPFVGMAGAVHEAVRATKRIYGYPTKTPARLWKFVLGTAVLVLSTAVDWLFVQFCQTTGAAVSVYMLMVFYTLLAQVLTLMLVGAMILHDLVACWQCGMQWQNFTVQGRDLLELERDA